MAVFLGNAELLDCVPFEVEFDKDTGLITHDPGVMTRRDGENTRGDMVFDTAVAEDDANTALGQKTHMGVHAELGLGDGLHLGGPAETGGVDHALHPGVSGCDDIQFNAADVAVVGAGDGGEKGIDAHIIFLLFRD